MSYPYLIELRLRGDTKDVAKKLIFDIYKKFHVRGAVRKRPVPHVSLFGPFSTRSLYEVKQAIRETGSSYSALGYEVSGFDYFEQKKKSFLIPRKKKHVIYLKIKPNEDLKEFRELLAKKLFGITRSKDIKIDKDSDFKFHATLAMKDIHHRFDEIWDYLKSYDIKTKGVCYRVTLLQNGQIVCEYDFVQKRILGRRNALSKKHWMITKRLLEDRS